MKSAGRDDLAARPLRAATSPRNSAPCAAAASRSAAGRDRCGVLRSPAARVSASSPRALSRAAARACPSPSARARRPARAAAGGLRGATGRDRPRRAALPQSRVVRRRPYRRAAAPGAELADFCASGSAAPRALFERRAHVGLDAFSRRPSSPTWRARSAVPRERSAIWSPSSLRSRRRLRSDVVDRHATSAASATSAAATAVELKARIEHAAERAGDQDHAERDEDGTEPTHAARPRSAAPAY